MRVVQIIDSLRLAGGAERLQRSLAEAVEGKDVEVTVVTLRRDDSAVVEDLEAAGARVVPIHASRFASPGRARRLVGFLRRERFDVVHTHLVRASILGLAAARLAGIPGVATLHNTRPNARLHPWLRSAESWVLRHWADRVVAVGWETARVHGERLGGRRIDVIPNAVGEISPLAPDERAALREELGVPPESTLVIAVGRLHPQKAFPDLLRAMEILVADGHDVRLRIAGGGPLEDEIRAEIEGLDLGDRIQLLGLRRDVPRLLAASDVYASSSAWEGLPVATLEAMAAGLPVVATAVGDVAQVVDESCGTLVAPGQPHALAKALAPLVDDPALRRAQGNAARLRARTEHGLDVWAERLLGLYREVGAVHPGGGATGAAEDRSCA